MERRERLAAVIRRPAAQEAAVCLLATALIILAGRDIMVAPVRALLFAALPAAAALAFLRPKLGLFVAAAVIMAIEEFDLSSTEAYFEAGLSESVLAVRIAGVSFMDAFTLLFLLPALIGEWDRWRRGGGWRVLPMDRHFLPLLLVYAFGATQGLFHALSFSDFTWEARDLLYIMAWYFIASRVMETRRDATVLVAVLLGVFSLKSVLFLYRLAAGQGLFYGFDFYRPALGSDIPFMGVPLIATLAAAVLFRDGLPGGHRLGQRGWRLLLAALSAYWSVWFVQSLGRASYITAGVAMLVIAVLYRRELRNRQVARTALAALAGGAFYYFIAVSAANRALLDQMFATTVNWKEAVTLYGDLSIGQRLLEIMNIGETLSRAHAWLWGLGWGAAWTEAAVKMPVDVAAFEYMESVRGVHTAAHLDLFYFLLKVGILGTALLYGAYLRIVAAGARLLRAERDPWTRLALTVALAMLIIFIPNYVYFIKLKLLLGMAIAILSFLAAGRETQAGAGSAVEGRP